MSYFTSGTRSRPALEPTQPRIQWVPWARSSRVKRLGWQTDSPEPRGEIKKPHDDYEKQKEINESIPQCREQNGDGWENIISSSHNLKLNYETPRRWSASELCRPSDRRLWCQLLRIEGVAWSAQRMPTVVNLDFLNQSRYFFFQVASQLSSRG
jgi:hypothetical protein